MHFSVYEPMKIEDDVEYFQMLIKYLHDNNFGHGYWFGFDEDNYEIYRTDEWKEWRYGIKESRDLDVMVKEYRKLMSDE